jgi:hypothetical protein
MTHTITNSHRAAWAIEALAPFVRKTHHTTTSRLGKEDLADAIVDLICDLLHLANQSRIDPEDIVARAQFNYETDLLEEEYSPA